MARSWDIAGIVRLQQRAPRGDGGGEGLLLCAEVWIGARRHYQSNHTGRPLPSVLILLPSALSLSYAPLPMLVFFSFTSLSPASRVFSIPLSRSSPTYRSLPPPSDPGWAKPMRGDDGGGGASLRRGLEAWLWRWILSGRLGTTCVWPWRRSRSDVTSSTFGCLHRRSKGIWSVGVASRWLPDGWSTWGGDGGLAAEVGEDATIVGGARGCRFSRWRQWLGVHRSIVSRGNLISGGGYNGRRRLWAS